MPTPVLDNRQLGPDTARANLLTNGGMEIWQRGAGPFSTNGVVTADRWAIGLAGTDTISISKSTSGLPVGSTACAACTFTLGNGAGASFLYQGIGTPDGYQLAGRTCTFSVQVKTTVANAVRIALNNYYSGTSHYTYSGYHSGSGNWETLSVTVTFDATATLFQPTFFFAASATIYLDNAMLVVGSQAADFQPMHPADDLARCLRYYETHMSIGFPAILGVASAASQNIGYGLGYAHKPMAPTVTKVGTWAVTNCGQPTVAGAGPDGYMLYVTSSAAGQVQAQPNSAANGVTIEWNP